MISDDDATMIISRKKAQSIVEEISSIIGRNINFMNEDGIIVASTDLDRIGTLHTGALEVLKTRDILIVNEVDKLSGAKEGINAPIILGNKIVGVIGITGAEDEVVKYSNIIRKMTEILVKEEFIEKELELENRIRESFVKEWIEGKWGNENLFVSRASLLGVNVHLPRVIVVIEYDQTFEAEDIDYNKEIQMEKEHNKLIQFIQNKINVDHEDIIIPDGRSKFIMLLTWIEKSPDERKDRTTKKIKSIIKRLMDNNFVQCKVGVGTFFEHYSEVNQSYKHAEKAVSFLRRPKEDDFIVYYEDLRLGLLVEGIPEALLNEFKNKVLGIDLIAKDHEFIDTLTCYFAHNQAITETARKLHIHKNTLQYRLKRIKSETGYDPRLFKDAVLLYLAIYVYHLNSDQDP